MLSPSETNLSPFCYRYPALLLDSFLVDSCGFEAWESKRMMSWGITSSEEMLFIFPKVVYLTLSEETPDS